MASPVATDHTNGDTQSTADSDSEGTSQHASDASSTASRKKHGTPSTMKKNASVEALDAEGKWVPGVVKSKHQDGTFSIILYTGKILKKIAQDRVRLADPARVEEAKRKTAQDMQYLNNIKRKPDQSAEGAHPTQRRRLELPDGTSSSGSFSGMNGGSHSNAMIIDPQPQIHWHNFGMARPQFLGVVSPESTQFDCDSTNHVRCFVCRQFYTDPRLLSCLHSFCLGCCASMATDIGGKRVLSCPRCQEQTILVGDVTQLVTDSVLAHSAQIARAALGISSDSSSSSAPRTWCDVCGRDEDISGEVYCRECAQMLCDVHMTAHARLKKNKDHRVVAVNQLPPSELKQLLGKDPQAAISDHTECPLHPQKKLAFQCSTCNTPACPDCYLTEHQGHSITSLEKAAELSLTAVRIKMGELKMEISRLTEESAAVANLHTETIKRSENMERQAAAAFDQVVDYVHQRVAQLTKIATEAAPGRAPLSDEAVTAVQADISTRQATKLLTEQIMKLPDVELLSVYNSLVNNVQRLSDSRSPDSSDTDIKFELDDSVDQTLKNAIKVLGQSNMQIS